MAALLSSSLLLPWTDLQIGDTREGVFIEDNRVATLTASLVGDG